MACVTGQAPSTAHAHKMTMIRTVVIVRKVEIGIFYLKYNIQGWCVVAFLRGAGVIPHCKRAVPLAEHGNPPSPLRDAAANILLGFVAWPLLCHNTWWGENTNRRINCLPPPDLILLLSSARLPNNKPIIFPLSSFSLVRNATSGFWPSENMALHCFYSVRQPDPERKP